MTWFKIREKKEDLNIYSAERREKIRDLVFAQMTNKYLPRVESGEKVLINIDEFEKEKFVNASDSMIMSMVIEFFSERQRITLNELIECKTIQVWKSKK